MHFAAIHQKSHHVKDEVKVLSLTHDNLTGPGPDTEIFARGFAHPRLEDLSRIFDEVAAELGRSLDHFNVPEREKGEVLAAFAAHKSEVTEGYSQ